MRNIAVGQEISEGIRENVSPGFFGFKPVYSIIEILYNSVFANPTPPIRKCSHVGRVTITTLSSQTRVFTVVVLTSTTNPRGLMVFRVHRAKSTARDIFPKTEKNGKSQIFFHYPGFLIS